MAMSHYGPAPENELHRGTLSQCTEGCPPAQRPKTYLLTVKLRKNPLHDPQNKLNGDCPVTGRVCTDSTGEHHTLLIEGTSLAEVQAKAKKRFSHVTRIEEVSWFGERTG